MERLYDFGHLVLLKTGGGDIGMLRKCIIPSCLDADASMAALFCG